jgi:hypothetical protein
MHIIFAKLGTFGRVGASGSQDKAKPVAMLDFPGDRRASPQRKMPQPAED